MDILRFDFLCLYNNITQNRTHCLINIKKHQLHRRHEDASLEYTGLNRHASDTRIGLMDSTVPIEAMLDRENE